MVTTAVYTKEYILQLLDQVKDPEIPVVSIAEMGMLRDVIITAEACNIYLTPTYTGCPAMDMITADIYTVLEQAAIPHVHVHMVYSPAWTTDWMSDETKQKLKEFGIAAPIHSSCVSWLDPLSHEVPCPRCQSTQTEVISKFGSTACKALYVCKACHEPFDYFKCH